MLLDLLKLFVNLLNRRDNIITISLSTVICVEMFCTHLKTDFVVSGNVGLMTENDTHVKLLYLTDFYIILYVFYIYYDTVRSLMYLCIHMQTDIKITHF